MLDDADRCSFTQNKFNPRVFSPEHRDQRSQQTVGCRADKTNLQAAAGAAGAAGAAERTACRFAQLLASNQEFAGLNQNGTAAWREHYATGLAGKQFRSQLGFELLDRHRKRWLRHVQTLGGTAKIQRFSKNDKVANASQIHRAPMVMHRETAMQALVRNSEEFLIPKSYQYFIIKYLTTSAILSIFDRFATYRKSHEHC